MTKNQFKRAKRHAFCCNLFRNDIVYCDNILTLFGLRIIQMPYVPLYRCERKRATKQII